MIYAYARVSSRDQNLTRQLDAFAAFGVEKRNIYCDKKAERILKEKVTLSLCASLKKATCL